MTEVSDPRDNASRSALNALAILEALAAAEEVISLSEICRRCGVPKATAFRYLAAFESTGYAVRNRAGGGYALGPRVVALATCFYGQDPLLSLARGSLPELAAESGETAHVAVLQDDEAVYVDIAEGPQHVRAIVRRGERLPAYCVASGRAILAHAPAAEVEATIRQGLAPRTPRTITDPEAFRAELAAVVKRGYAANVGEWVEEVVGVSAPLFNSEGKVVAAVGVSMPSSRLKSRKRIDELGQLVRAFADRLSTRLASHR